MDTETKVAIIGAIAGAASGGLVSLILASAKGEREERGRRRLEARSAIAVATREFQYAIGEARLCLYKQESLNDDYSAKATKFAGILRRASLSLPWRERRQVQRKIKRLVGSAIYQLAELRPPEAYEIEGDGAALTAIAEARPVTEEPLFDSRLLLAKPTSTRWDDLLRELRRLQQKYP
jgi:hypothetical protein